ncbi:11222_t:CDS:2 [Ambispora gerdemannii]|uniref:11222_t:CDS:1 n=1 Tax=Ambispora gerdemannii TaxID=144530 RepID=A0A9N8YX64_9GLOM|nr:11222_t:CDS:2 [Ambispora gerdemannii]
MSSSIPPNPTLYVRNLNEKTPKEELKRSLYGLFSAYGRILDIVALKTIRMRGQAFVVFKEIQSATAAMRGLNGFMFYDKPMHIEYAKTKSDAIAKLDGTWKKSLAATSTEKTAHPTLASIPASAQTTSKRGLEDEESQKTTNGRQKQRESVSPPSVRMEEDEEQEAMISRGEPEALNRILYIMNLPPDVTDEMLSYLFQQYPGFKEVRLVPGKSDIAFVEYETDHQAAVAKDVLNGFKITHDKEMKVTFAKR